MNPSKKALLSLKCLVMCTLMVSRSTAFTNIAWNTASSSSFTTRPSKSISIPSKSRSNTSMQMVWWLGGSESASSKTDESCEVVPVRIDKTSPNSRRIGGEVTVDAPMEDVWAILTDYDNLSTHVPNLVESRRIRGTSVPGSIQGDGRYKCRLFQKGAQKIVGFNFAASVTLDMTEQVILESGTTNAMNDNDNVNDDTIVSPEQRKIFFKCFDSQFFSNFDGEWKVIANPANANQTTVSYVVDVRPKGPVPVAALEWRIREDVPTNLLAVKKASIDQGLEGVLALRSKQQGGAVNRALSKVERRPTRGRNSNSDAARLALRDGRNRVRNIMDRLPQQSNSSRLQPIPVPVPVSAQWEDNETMAAYLKK